MLVVLSACSSVDCPVDNIVATVYKMYKSDGTLDTLRTDTLTITSQRADRSDTILLNRSIDTQSFQLPVSLTQDIDTLYLTFADTATVNHKVLFDTLYIYKTNTPRFESVDCNISYFHEITDIKYTRNRLDSIVVNKSSVNYDLSKEHLRVYVKR